MWFFSVFADSVQFNPSRIRCCQDFSRFSFQNIIIFHFQSNDSLIISACKPKHLRRECPHRIITPVIFIYFYPRKSCISNFISCFFLHICTYSFYGRNFFYFFPYSLLRYPQFFCQKSDHFFRLFYLTVNYRNRTHCFICSKYFSLCVHNFTTCGLNVSFPFMKILRFFIIIIRTKAHKIDQSANQTQDHQQTQKENDPHFPFMKCIIFFHKKILWKTVLTIYDCSPEEMCTTLYLVQPGLFVCDAFAFHIVIFCSVRFILFRWCRNIGI